MLEKMAKTDGKVDALETHAADDAAVRRAYRLAAKKCHPDILRASGASEGRIAAATEQMARINDAWDTIRKARGM